MVETIEFTNRILGRYIEMHTRMILQGLEVAETMNKGLFAVCKAALSNSEASCSSLERDSR